MKNIKSAFALFGLVAAIAFALPAAAQMGRDSGYYIGGSIGQSRAKDVCSDANLFGGAANCDDKDTAWRVFGGYQFNRNFAVELGYHDLGKASIPARKIDSTAWEAVGVGSIPLGPVSLYGKLGAFRGKAECSGCAPDIEETRGGVTFGAGVEYDFTRQFGMRGEWQRYNNLGGGRFTAKYDVNVFSLGALFRFQ